MISLIVSSLLPKLDPQQELQDYINAFVNQKMQQIPIVQSITEKYPTYATSARATSPNTLWEIVIFIRYPCFQRSGGIKITFCFFYANFCIHWLAGSLFP